MKKYIYYKDDGTIISIMKSLHEEYSEYKYIESETEDIIKPGKIAKVKNGKICYENAPEPKVDKKAEIQSLIETLKAQLASTDYQAIKYAEGWISEEEYALIKENRQAIRDEINRLELEQGRL